MILGGRGPQGQGWAAPTEVDQAAVTSAPRADRPPNILLILADQLAPQLTGPYGNREVRTPHLDRLAREGVVFAAAYSNCPLCVPARAALLSGRYPSRLGIYDNASVLGSEVPTIAHHLRVAHYETVLSGKMHFVGADQLHGCEQCLTEDIYPADFAWTPRWETEAVLNPRGAPKARLVLEARVQASPAQMRYDDQVQQASLAFLRSRRQVPAQDCRPFFLCVSFSDPHGPYQVPRELWDLYADVPIALPQIPADLAAHESPMDRWINVFHGVDKSHLRDREVLYRFRRVYYGQVTYIDHTAVLFTSDHGDMAAERTMVEKRTFYEFSARVPLLARLPARWRGGRTCREPVSLVDILPTLTELAQAPAPIDIDGRSFLDLLDGRPTRWDYHPPGSR